MIGQSMINVDSGGRGRLSGITAAISLLLCILFASRFIEMIPLAALVGVMFMVVFSTFEWTSFRIIHKIPRADAFVLILVLVFAWKSGKHIKIHSYVNERGIGVHNLHGPLFFGSVRKFLEYFDPHKDTEDVVIDFQHSRVCDHSGIEAIRSLSERYLKLGKRLHLKQLSTECQRSLKSTKDFVMINILDEPQYLMLPSAGERPMLAPHHSTKQLAGKSLKRTRTASNLA